MTKLILIFLTIPFLVNNQEQPDPVKYWKRSDGFAANTTQVSLSNWAAGGQSSMAGVFL